MATKIQICNMSLRLIGANRITAITDSVEPARVLTDVYDMIRDEVLSAHPWGFAIKRVLLSEDATAPIFNYAHRFTLPVDCLRVIKMEDDDMTFLIEGDYLVTDEGTAYIKYIAQITDTTIYSPAFITAFAQRLAAEICYPITNSATKAKAAYELYLLKKKEAKGISAQEGTAQVIDEDKWEQARS